MLHIKLSKLKNCNLSFNHLDKVLGQMLLDPKFGLVSCSLETLQLVSVGIDKHSTYQTLLARNLQYMTNLYELDLSENSGINFGELCKDLCVLQHL